MAIGEASQEHRREIEEESESDEFECTDDSDGDPSFNIVEETRSAMSKLSIKKPRARRCKFVDDDNVESESEREVVENEIPKMDKKDDKSFEKVEQLIIEGGHLEKLTLDQCKVYLRKYGLRLTGNKSIKKSRIREHREYKLSHRLFIILSFQCLCIEILCYTKNIAYNISLAGHLFCVTIAPFVHEEIYWHSNSTVACLNNFRIIHGCGEMKYPAESFVINCKGDACLGDVVIFEQNVYDMFNIASRSATGPPCGTRTVAGRIVKESYGVAKQQHTFTIEVLWSKGVKPLPPLHQLLIKGRNLYRIKTMRQRWADERERLKVLQEKHGRGCRARNSREMRLNEKEKWTKKIVIKRKNLSDDRIPADKENLHPQKANTTVHQVNVFNNTQYKHEQKVKSNITSSATTQQKTDDALIIQQAPPQSILGNPPTAEQLQHYKANHHVHQQHYKAHYKANHHVHQQHYKANHHEFHGGHLQHKKANHHEFHGGHLQHKNYSYRMNQNLCENQFVYVPLQQQNPEYQRRQPCNNFSQGH